MFLNASIETDRLILRPYRLEDVDETYAAVSEKDFYQYIPEDPPTRDGVRRIIEWSIEQNKKNTPEKIYKFTLAIIHKQSEKIIGYCGLGPDDLGMDEVELYYGISSDYRKQGLALEATQATLRYGFEVIGLKKIIALADYRNIPSIKLLEKLGMKYHFRINHLQEEFKDFENQCYHTITAQHFAKSL